MHIGNWKFRAALSSAFLLVGSSYAGVEGSITDAAKQKFAELSGLTDENPFATDNFKMIDPNSRKKVDRVLVGPVFEVPMWQSSDFDYYRYVTFYNVTRRKSRIYSLPTLHEECHDRSEFFGNFAYATSYSASVKASATSKIGLGLEASFTATRTFTVARNMRATGGIIADHTPYYNKEDWRGLTYIQTYSKQTGKTRLITQTREGTPLWLMIIFPYLSQVKYPYEFEALDADWTLSVERTNVEKCRATGLGDTDSSALDDDNSSNALEAARASASAAAINYQSHR